jgi:uncharacterized membrane protein (UPF0127 family)
MAALLSLSKQDVTETGRVHSRRSMRVVRVTRADGAVVATHCEVAESTYARMRGLLGLKSLEPGRGMLINPAPSVMTFFMRFPIDVVFLDRDYRVVRIAQDLRPWRLAGARRAVASLELPAGTAAAHRLKEGDILLLEPSL